jgi:uncharacterized protein (TIGR02444 family)
LPEDDSLAQTFWSTTLSLYGRPGVPEACLMLQDRDGLDVNMVLWCIWCGTLGRPVAPALAAQAVAACAPWRAEVLEPLRALRRHMKAGIAGVPKGLSDPLRDQVKGAELDAERVQHAVLAGLAPGESASPSRDLALANVRAYSPAAGTSEVNAVIEAAFRS